MTWDGYNVDQTAIAVAYKDNRMIGDEVLPRVNVNAERYTWLEYDLASGFTVPDTAVSRRGYPNEVDIPSTEHESRCKDYALDDPIPNPDIEASKDKMGLVNRKTEFLTGIMVLDREVRVANMVQDSANYPAASVKAPATAWSDLVNADPIKDVRDTMGAMILRPNTLVFGYDLWQLFAAHPKVVKACNRNDGGEGFARRADVAELFEVEKVLVGEAIVNIKRPGQTPEFKKAWGKKLSALYLDPLGGPEGMASFGWTAEFLKRSAGQIPDPRRGVRGTTIVRVAESVDEVISCPSLGALLEHP